MLLSIIMPVYNAEKYLERTMQCVFAQTIRDFELIIVDDGSTDNSWSLCEKFLNMDTRVQVIHQENKGIGVARNTGLEQAHGEYIGFIDCDDLIHPQMFEILLYIAGKENADIVMLKNKMVPENFLPSSNVYNKEDIPYHEIPTKDMYCKMFSTSVEDAPYLAVWNKIYRNKIAKTYSFPTSGTEDAVYNCYMYHLAKKSILLDTEPDFYYWVQRTHSVSHSAFSNYQLMILQSFFDMSQFLIQYEKSNASYALDKTYKVVLRTRYNSKGTIYEEKVNEMISKNAVDFTRAFYACKKIAISKKIVYCIFYYIPCTYGFMRKCIELYIKLKHAVDHKRIVN